MKLETTLTKDELKNMPEYKEQRSGGHPSGTISASAGAQTGGGSSRKRAGLTPVPGFRYLTELR